MSVPCPAENDAGVAFRCEVAMDHHASTADLEFRRAFEACVVSPVEFDHAAHVRLAYTNLCDLAIDDATQRMKASLLSFLTHLGIGHEKYHETITRAWIMAVHYFMTRSEPQSSAASFTAANPELLDSGIMLTHYSAKVLFSPGARAMFVEPDIQSIPPPAKS